MTTNWTVARQVAFYPSNAGGKVHAAWKITHTAVCSATVDLEPVAWIHTTAGQAASAVHPMVCRRCLRATTRDPQAADCAGAIEQ